MDKDNGNGTLDFVRQQLDIVRRQCTAIDRGDLVTARVAGNQLKRSMPGLARLVRQNNNGNGNDDSEAETINEILTEIRALVERATDRLLVSRDNMAQLLREFRRGRQILTRYYSGRRETNRLFDMHG